MSKEQFDSELQKIRKVNTSIEYKRRLREEKRKRKPKRRLPSTSKIVLMVSAILCVEILAFCQYMILVTGDTNALYAMVGALFTFMAVVLGYFVKSTKENSRDGITFETAMAAFTQPPIKEDNDTPVG